MKVICLKLHNIKIMVFKGTDYTNRHYTPIVETSNHV